MDKGRDMKREPFWNWKQIVLRFPLWQGEMKGLSLISSALRGTSVHLDITLVLSASLCPSSTPLLLSSICALAFPIMHRAVRGAAVTPVVRTSCPPRGATEDFIPPPQEARRGSRTCVRSETILGWTLPRWSSWVGRIAQVPEYAWWWYSIRTLLFLMICCWPWTV